MTVVGQSAERWYSQALSGSCKAALTTSAIGSSRANSLWWRKAPSGQCAARVSLHRTQERNS
ncbi:hypothetical protein E2C01_045706 [Portunus trituberculatus]|uniref:Uncharacterized protein n=1 Tax=Portunus trituberculatus TaxID=210409 RepID=A0A5B7FZ04_PORTR|nr:hypothetical protein [Portunus trituberculatus]